MQLGFEFVGIGRSTMANLLTSAQGADWSRRTIHCGMYGLRPRPAFICAARAASLWSECGGLSTHQAPLD